MRIEPVFVVAPEAKPPSMPTRRAFLMIGGAFAFGSVVGGACGYSLGAGKAGVAEAAAGKGGEAEGARDELRTSGDARLDALRRLAVKAPVADLVENWNQFCADFFFDYPEDPVLWKGADRLAAWALSHPEQAGVPFLTTLLQLVSVDARAPSTNLKRFEHEIRQLRKSKSK